MVKNATFSFNRLIFFTVDSLCEITPQEPLTTIDTDLYDDLDAMDNLGMPIIDEDDLDRAFDFEYEVILSPSSVKCQLE